MEILLLPFIFFGHGIRPFADWLLWLVPDSVGRSLDKSFGYMCLFIYLVGAGVLAASLFTWAIVCFGWATVVPYLLAYLVMCYALRER